MGWLQWTQTLRQVLALPDRKLTSVVVVVVEMRIASQRASGGEAIFPTPRGRTDTLRKPQCLVSAARTCRGTTAHQDICST